MRIAIMAAGAVGGYFGARWAAAGHDVVFIARGAHLDAIRRNGLKVESPLGDLHLKNVNATDDAASAGTVDAVLFAVKLWDTEKAGELTRPLVGPRTRVITVQNGVDSVERLAPILGGDAVIGGSTYVVAVIAAPGVIRHGSNRGIINCGRLDGRRDDLLAQHVTALQAPGMQINLLDEMHTELWKKFVMLAGTSGATAGTRRPLGEILADEDMRRFFHALMAEAAAVGRAAGANLPDNLADERLRAAKEFPAGMRASMANDLNAGNRLELDWLGGKVSTLGRKFGVATPANDAVYAMLKPHRMGRAKD